MSVLVSYPNCEPYTQNLVWEDYGTLTVGPPYTILPSNTGF